MFKLNKSKIKMLGQSTAEYAILIGVVVAAAVGMQTYVKRGVQARVHDESMAYYNTAFANNSADWTALRSDLTNPITVSGITAGQYEPEDLSSRSTQQTVSDVKRNGYNAGGTVSRSSDTTTTQDTGDYQKYDYDTN